MDADEYLDDITPYTPGEASRPEGISAGLVPVFDTDAPKTMHEATYAEDQRQRFSTLRPMTLRQIRRMLEYHPVRQLFQYQGVFVHLVTVVGTVHDWCLSPKPDAEPAATFTLRDHTDAIRVEMSTAEVHDASLVEYPPSSTLTEYWNIIGCVQLAAGPNLSRRETVLVASGMVRLAAPDQLTHHLLSVIRCHQVLVQQGHDEKKRVAPVKAKAPAPAESGETPSPTETTRRPKLPTTSGGQAFAHRSRAKKGMTVQSDLEFLKSL